ncbi:MAG: T9SS type A sorting domain-containing protein, partial [Cyclobacteriaceae bacterium]
TVKTYTRINNLYGGFGFNLTMEDRFSRSISFLGDLRGDGTIAVNYGAGAGAGSAGALYLLFFKPCDFTQESGSRHWNGGITLYSNWTHSTQTVSDSLSFEQCTSRAFETDAPYMTYNFNDGRCICKDSSATLTVSSELSTAFSNGCKSSLPSPNVILSNFETQISIFPNPTNSELVIENHQTSYTRQDNVKLFSILGKQLYDSPINSPRNTIDLYDFPEGAYILFTRIGERVKTFKVLKK